ncbi:MAG: SCO family protein [Verrucomicrobiales bacterium]|nr:SCO family protein [Verrucomicrobiales bacterium]
MLISFNTRAAVELSLAKTNVTARAFMVRGIVTELKPDGRTIVIRHEAISNYMAAMTMPFKVKEPDELVGLKAGDKISFRLQVTETESWVDQIANIGTAPVPQNPPAVPPAKKAAAHPLLDYKFTNELGRAVSINDFHGQALAITFFFTRCPLPEFCPRLSKNFSEASLKLKSQTNAPANWHFLSITFDPEFDSPAMLKAYGESYQYDPEHWSFLTGPTNEISELASQSGVVVESDDGSLNHNFRTLIIDATGHLQIVFPTGGDLSDAIVSEIIKAAATTNQPAMQSR